MEYDEDEYEAALSNLADEWSKGRISRFQAVVKELMDKTAPQRRKWIEQDRPMVSDGLSKYPSIWSKQTCTCNQVYYQGVMNP